MMDAISFSSLPALKQPLDGGVFCGLVTEPDGKHYAIVLLDARPKKRLTWPAAMDWAKQIGGRLPTRAIASICFSLARDLFEASWHWTGETEISFLGAWAFDFFEGFQSYASRREEVCAVAVRLIPLAG